MKGVNYMKGRIVLVKADKPEQIINYFIIEEAKPLPSFNDKNDISFIWVNRLFLPALTISRKRDYSEITFIIDILCAISQLLNSMIKTVVKHVYIGLKKNWILPVDVGFSSIISHHCDSLIYKGNKSSYCVNNMYHLFMPQRGYAQKKRNIELNSQTCISLPRGKCSYFDKIEIHSTALYS
ncbi:MAG: hypothetical protein J1E62_11555 [Lachnospiraceae bacterium]|nr:hypothetical protein [Lachnospiraceae bacterium]